VVQSTPGACVSASREDGEGFLKFPSAGYNFAISHPALASVLTGTTNLVHLEQNVEAALAPALTSGEIEQLRQLLQETEVR
jgi:aryl-alcohol dehydrogenase-like predicted oxidoreductase